METEEIIFIALGSVVLLFFIGTGLYLGLRKREELKAVWKYKKTLIVLPSILVFLIIVEIVWISVIAPKFRLWPFEEYTRTCPPGTVSGKRVGHPNEIS